MRIAVDFSGSIALKSSVGGGGLTYLKNFSRILTRIDGSNEYFLIMERRLAERFDPITDNVKLVKMPFQSRNTVRRLLWQQLVLPILLRRIEIDILYSTVNIAPILSPCPIVLAFRIPPRVLISGRKNLRGALRYHLMHKSLGIAKCIIAVSKFAKREISQHFNIPEQKIYVVYHGVGDAFLDALDRSFPSNRVNPDVPEQPFILSVSNLHPHKNYANLIKAYKILRERYSCQHKLVIIGAATNKEYFKRLRNLIYELRLFNDIMFIPGMPNDKLPFWYSSADVYVLPSLHETFGMTILEAMACGTPVVASNISAIPEIGDKSALYFNPNDPEDIAVAIWKVISNPGLRGKMVELGKQRVANFSWENTVRKTLVVIQKAYEASLRR